ncbi:hypothetical protein [Jannaschia sp. 2305UL9-9]|uniref:hypothetical protein n=1 Tax=Jannaschia sp. 2305UL9-9 TaxID=3121638 RepID=UPI003526CE08
MLKEHLARSLACLVLMALAVLPLPAKASDIRVSAPVVIGDDPGGPVLERARQVRALRQSGQDVRIVGAICNSACTMLLGLPQTCVSPRTIFGFHGPSRGGQRLDRAQFDRASHFIAQHYPPSLGRWYMNTARHRTQGVHKVAGSDLIAMGVRRCA